MWYDPFGRVPGNSSGSYDGGPKRLVLHTTEGPSIEGAIAAYRKNNSWPHFTIDPVRKVGVQHVDTSVPARALKNLAGGVETNREQAIQVEIVGYAAATQDMPDDQIKWLADVLRPVVQHEGIHLTTVPFYGTDAGFTLARANAPQRMSFQQWQNFNGICGHQHVPENDHWDPGKFPIQKFISYLGDDMSPEIENMIRQLHRFHFQGLNPDVDNGGHAILTTNHFVQNIIPQWLSEVEGRLSQRIVDSENRQNGAIAQAVVQSEQRISRAITEEVKKIVDAIAAIEIIEGDGDCPDCPEVVDPNTVINQFVDNLIELVNSQRPAA